MTLRSLVFKFTKIVGGIGLMALSAPVLATMFLPVLGFTVEGVAAGSVAAAAQSAFYGASTCGVFSVLQAAGATAVAPGFFGVVAAISGFLLGVKLFRA
ncbi:hypothetical protein L227DRAFT_657537 [Lentinus tigrinus ALCF2SS1-6]|uniref:Uncharacterized protein n=2 Tax=Lentinus tigrinus TaxID=5365 RepID=A0A5C2RS15_9APHY|nr:hypothetical protein L227DRAFT_657537 [Lentinus tigrinus ALCF2SS1-6]